MTCHNVRRDNTIANSGGLETAITQQARVFARQHVNHVQAYNTALQNGHHSEAYDFARQIGDPEVRASKTREITEIWVNQGDLETLAAHVTAHVLTHIPGDGARGISDLYPEERYRIALETCQDPEQIDTLVTKILTIFASLTVTDYSEGDELFCDSECSDQAGFANACLHFEDNLLEKMLIRGKFNENDVKISSMFYYLFSYYDITTLDQGKIEALLSSCEEVRHPAIGGAQGYVRYNPSRELSKDKDTLKSSFAIFGRGFFDMEFLCELHARNPALASYAFELMAESS